MKFGLVAALTIFTIALGWLGYLPFKKNQKKDKVYYFSFLIISWFLSVLLIYFPKIAGPTQLVDWIYSPLTKLIK